MSLIKTFIAYVILFPLIGALLEYVGVEHIAYFAAYGAVFAMLSEHIIK